MNEQGKPSPESEAVDSFQTLLNAASMRYNNLFASIEGGGVHLSQVSFDDYISTANSRGEEIPDEVLAHKKRCEKYAKDLQECMAAASLTAEEMSDWFAKIKETQLQGDYPKNERFIKSIIEKVEIVFKEMLKRGYTEQEIIQ